MKNNLNSGEINNSKNLWLRISPEELINSDKFENLKNFLRLTEDEIGLYRCTARTSQNSLVPYETRNPIILNRNHVLTKLIVEDCHYRIIHNGERHTPSKVRKEYWIPRGKSYIRQILYHCIVCRRLNSRPYNYPRSPNLPLSRVNDSYPFICTGIGYTGAVYCRSIYNDDVLNEKDPFKCYIVVFTCASTRGVILDVVPDGSAETFINSLKKFISKGGCPAKILSDNGGVFVADITQKFATVRNVKWDLGLKEAPWYGGFRERLVGQLKRCLKKTTGRAYLNFYELQTVTNEIEFVLNSRPLGALHDDDLEESLTPNHLVYGRQLHFNNYNDSLEDGVFDAHKRIEYLETVLSHFWNR